MDCNYIIQLPGGGDNFVVIPANYGTISENSGILASLESLDEDSPTYILNLDKIVHEIYERTGKSILSEEKIRNTIIQNLDTPQNAIDVINEAVINNSEFDGLAKALKNYFILNKNTPNFVKDFNDKLSKPLSAEYFKRMSIEGVFNTTNLRSEHLKIQSTIEESLQSGLNPSYMLHLDAFLTALKEWDGESYVSNTLMLASNQYGTKGININNINFFREGDYNSLVLSLIKKVGSKIDKNVLKEIVGETKEPFFNQILRKAYNLQDSAFEQLLKTKTSTNRKVLNRLISEITQILGGNPDLENSIKLLVNNLSENNIEEVKPTIKESDDDKQFRIFKYQIKYNSQVSNTVENYSDIRTLSKATYSNVSQNLTSGEDVLLEAINNKLTNVLITDIFPRKGDRVHIRGIYKSEGGTFEEFTKDYGISDNINYRTKEQIKKEFDPDIVANEYLINVGKKFNQDTLKFILIAGDIVNHNFLVKGIYPESVRVENLNNGVISNIPYSEINNFKSEGLYYYNAYLSDVNSLPVIDTLGSIIKGDIVKYKNNYYVVIDNSKAGMLTIFKYDNGKNIIIDIEAKDVKETRVTDLDEISTFEIDLVTRNINNLTKSSELSSFRNDSKVKTGDFGSGIINGELVSFKVLDNKSKRISTDNGIFTIWSNLSDVKFYTNRDISNRTSYDTIKTNNYKVSLKQSSEISNKDVKLRYVVPSHTSDKKFILSQATYYGNVGWYQDASIELSEGEIDKTPVILSQLKKKGLKGDGLYGTTENSKLLYNTTGLEKLNKFVNLDSNSKKELNVLQPGTYFTTIANSNEVPYLYKILTNVGGKITAEYNFINEDGNIIINEDTFEEDVLLQTKSESAELPPEGSIFNIYVPVNMKNLNVVINSVENNSSVEEIRSSQSLNELVTKINKTFEPLKIPVVQTSEGFTNNQRARIRTTNEGTTVMELNTKSGDFSDLIHETLHIYLTLLSYTDVNLYGSFINSVVKNSSNLSDAEEEFVKKVVDFAKGKVDFLYDDLKPFITTLFSVVNDMVFQETNKNLEWEPEDLINNPLSFLNTSLGSLYGINPLKNNHKMYNVGLLAAEPMYREWMIENDINLKCN